VLNSPIVAETAPLLVQACAQVGAVQIRNMGTLGGNVANAAACADSLPALVCLDAAARLLSPAGEKIMPLAELVVKPNQTLIPRGAADSPGVQRTTSRQPQHFPQTGQAQCHGDLAPDGGSARQVGY